MSTEVLPPNSFIFCGIKNGAETLSGNGALKYSTTGNPFVDQFGKLGSYKEKRSFVDISNDCELLWSIDKEKAIKMMFFIRMITRDVVIMGDKSVIKQQRGAELRHEGIMRMIWLSLKDKKAFEDNLPLYISVGSWRDLFLMLRYDLVFHGWENRKLNWNYFKNVIKNGLTDSSQVDLLKKYLPQISSVSKQKTDEAKANTIIAKWICSFVFGKKDIGTYKEYRKLKSSGTAHQWQQYISRNEMNKIDFSKIHGLALSKLVKGKFLQNHGLEDKYNEWITKPDISVKYTGFVNDLFLDLPESLVALEVSRRETINKQFQTLVEKGGNSEQTSLIVVRDTSGSMGSYATGTKQTCYDIAKSLALYFSEFLKGRFAKHWIEFNSTAKMHEWKGDTPLERWYNDTSNYVGSTNFQSVIELFAKIKADGVPESDFPTGILCISDSEFDAFSLSKTNVESALDNLRAAGFSDEYVNNFVIVLWNLQNYYYGRNSGKKFETFGNVNNVYYFSGYSAATVALLTSKIKNAEELLNEALNQDVLKLIKY